MLACDTALHRFNPSSDPFIARHLRAEPYPDSRNLPLYTMYTETEPKDNGHHFHPVPPTDFSRRPEASPGSDTREASDAPAQLSPEGVTSANYSLARSSCSTNSSSSSLPVPSTCSSSTHLASPSQTAPHPSLSSSTFSVQTPYPTEGRLEHQTTQLLAHFQHKYHPQLSSDSMDMQQSGGHNNMDMQQSGGHNSDSDSSLTENSRRYREFVPDQQKDTVYWEKRRKNNEAARKSREKRKLQDMVLEGRITCLEDDNSKLRRELLALKKRFKVPEGQPIIDPDREAAEPAHRKRSPSSQAPAGAPYHLQPASRISPGGDGLHKGVPYNSPPPLLAVGEAAPLALTMYSNSSNSGYPYFLPEHPTRMNPDGSLRNLPSGLVSSHHAHHQPGHPISSHHHLHHHQLTGASYPRDFVKDEPIEDGEIRIRERSNSSVERRTIHRVEHSESPLFRRASVGNYAQYRSPLSPPGPASHHNPYASSQVNPVHFLSRTFDTHPHPAWSQQRSPLSSHSSDDNSDEPLQLTVRRHSNQSHVTTIVDESSQEAEDSNPATCDKPTVSLSPPSSALPLKLRHKFPSHDMAYPQTPKDIFQPISQPPLSANPSSFKPHPFMNGLSELALSQPNPLSLAKAETPMPYTHRRDSRVSSRRTISDTKYLDPKYLERRRRNNEAARKCRENRKTLTKIREAKSDYLETENNKLRDELNSLQEEMKQLRELIEKKRLEQGIKDEPHVES